MNYYKRHIGDYATRTRTLSVTQHGIYNLLLDFYYTQEGPVTADDAFGICQCRTAKERHAVIYILDKFFTKSGDHYHNSRADEEIAQYQHRAGLNRQVGKKGGNPKKKAGYNEPGTVYAAPSADGSRVKIGISKSPRQRLIELRHKYGVPDYLAEFQVSDMGAAEKAAHDHFAGKMDGEWLLLDGSVSRETLPAVLAEILQPFGLQLGSNKAALSTNPLTISQEKEGDARARELAEDWKPPAWIADRLKMAGHAGVWTASDLGAFIAHYRGEVAIRTEKQWAEKFVKWMIRGGSYVAAATQKPPPAPKVSRPTCCLCPRMSTLKHEGASYCDAHDPRRSQ